MAAACPGPLASCAIATAALCAMPVLRAEAPIAVLEQRALMIANMAQSKPTHGLALTLAYFPADWQAEAIAAAAREAAGLLGQCGVAIVRARLVSLRAPDRYRDFHTPESRVLAGTLRLPTPAVYFVAGTRQDPAFDAEAIGRANSGTRPELTDTVWVARGARDPGLVLAHELAHVLMDSGEHSAQPGNLMREDTAPGNDRLDPAQCERLRAVGTRNGLLSPVAPGSR